MYNDEKMIATLLIDLFADLKELQNDFDKKIPESDPDAYWAREKVQDLQMLSLSVIRNGQSFLDATMSLASRINFFRDELLRRSEQKRETLKKLLDGDAASASGPIIS